MRILLVVDCYFPSKKSSAKLVHDLATELHNQGHRAIVVAPDECLTQPCQVTTESELTILRVRTGKIKGAGKIRRAWNEVRLSSVIWRSAKTFFRDNPCGLVVFYSPSIFFGDLVNRLKRLWKCKTYMILRDMFPQWAIDAGVLREGLISKYFRHKERFQYEVADIIGVQSSANLQYFEQKSIRHRAQLEVLFNWTTLDEKNVVQDDFRKKFGLENKLVFFYGGNIGVAQHMDNIIQLAENLRSFSDVHFLLVGEGSEVDRLQADIRRRSLSNISMRPAVGQNEYLALLSQVDVGLISLDRDLTTHNLPGKMLGYMYYSMPILASINAGNDLQNIVEEAHAGMVCIAGEHEELCDLATRFIQDAELRQNMGRNARLLLEKTFSVEQAAKQILSHT